MIINSSLQIFNIASLNFIEFLTNKTFTSTRLTINRIGFPIEIKFTAKKIPLMSSKLKKKSVDIVVAERVILPSLSYRNNKRTSAWRYASTGYFFNTRQYGESVALHSVRGLIFFFFFFTPRRATMIRVGALMPLEFLTSLS